MHKKHVSQKERAQLVRVFSAPPGAVRLCLATGLAESTCLGMTKENGDVAMALEAAGMDPSRCIMVSKDGMVSTCPQRQRWVKTMS